MATLSSARLWKLRLRRRPRSHRSTTRTLCSTFALEKVVKCRSCGYDDPPQIMHHSSVSSARRTQDRFCQQTAILGEDRIVYLDQRGRIRWIAAAWTDIDPADDFRATAAGRAAFRTIDLLELDRTLARIAARLADDV